MHDADGSGSRPYRNAARARASLRVRLVEADAEEGDGGWAVTRDVSRGGAFLRCAERFSPGTRLRLILEGDGGSAPLEVEAEIRWIASAEAPERGVGVAFVAPSAAVRRRLADVTAEGELPVLEIYDGSDEPAEP